MRIRPATLSLLLSAALLLPTAACSGLDASPSAEAQVRFGVDMAKRGLWNEALFRFQQAERMEPGSFHVWNNLAVAYEATGHFEQALEAYQRALRMQPGNRELRRNYSRFIEFYQSYKPEAAVAADEAAGTAPAEGEPVEGEAAGEETAGGETAGGETGGAAAEAPGDDG